MRIGRAPPFSADRKKKAAAEKMYSLGGPRGLGGTDARDDRRVSLGKALIQADDAQIRVGEVTQVSEPAHLVHGESVRTAAGAHDRFHYTPLRVVHEDPPRIEANHEHTRLELVRPGVIDVGTARRAPHF